jgi:hypothetical protein
MAEGKVLSKRQLAVINDIFAGELDEGAVLAKHKVSRSRYSRWLADEIFGAEFDRRVASAHRQSAALIARYAPLAAAKLVELVGSDKEETARKACLDIISLPALSAKRAEQPNGGEGAGTRETEQLPAKVCSRLLAALAEDKE